MVARGQLTKYSCRSLCIRDEKGTIVKNCKDGQWRLLDPAVEVFVQGFTEYCPAVSISCGHSDLSVR